MNFLPIVILIGFTFLPIKAQMLTLATRKPSPQIIWDDNGVSIIEHGGRKIVFGDHATGTYHEKPNSIKDSIYACYSNNTSICLSLNNDKLYLTSRNAESTHEYLFELEKDNIRGIPLCIFESNKDDLYFAMNVETGFIENEEASCCAWFKKHENGKIELENIVHIDFDAPLYLGLREDGKMKISKQNPRIPGMFPILDYPIVIPGAFVVASWRAGILWVIKDGETTPSQTIKLINLDENMITGKRRFPPAILDIQPMRNGHLLVARRSTKSINTSMEYAESLNRNQSSTNKQTDKPQIEVEWDEVDPLSGTVFKPDNFLVDSVTIPKTEQEAIKFNFGFSLDGKIISPWKYPIISEKKSKINDNSRTNSTN